MVDSEQIVLFDPEQILSSNAARNRKTLTETSETALSGSEQDSGLVFLTVS